MRTVRTLGLGAVLGAAGAYAVSRAERAGRAIGARVYGMDASVDDVTLTHQVESELFGSGAAPRGALSVNTANGVVQLRGEVASRELIDELVGRVRAVQGVRDVENLLHLPDADAPMHQ